MFPITVNKFNSSTEISALTTNDKIPPTLPKEKLKGKDFPFNSQWEVRCKYTRLIAWFILTTEVKAILAKFLKGKKVLEVASGTGYLSAHMKDAGIQDYTAVDLQEHRYWKDATLFDGIKGDALEYVKPEYNVVIMSWPSYESSFGAEVLKRMSGGQILIYQGESRGGCCGTAEMFDMLENDFTELTEISEELNDNHVRFSGIHDYWTVYIKNTVSLIDSHIK